MTPDKANALREAGPWRAEFGALYHRDIRPGFVFSVSPETTAAPLAKDLNERLALLAERERLRGALETLVTMWAGDDWITNQDAMSSIASQALEATDDQG
jgi:hypothetical protein